ncbi:MAG: asparagine synthase (glutamine-hydrolyzing), partial [Clostridiales bacterium]|nr:asparagine synthase (glutamine-hydrolyzing) [Clostridiales bacterium]
MCGIAGYFGSGSLQLLKDMLKSIHHRGPDGEGTFVAHNVGLGIKRLAIVDVDHGNQPIHNEDETLWIVYNGEIYNYQELKNDLIKKGHKFYTDTDTETILHAYQEWGSDCLKFLNGMFAFAIWDTKKKNVFLARDRLGIKPLYYFSNPEKLIFASEIKALLVDRDVPRIVNEDALRTFLLTGFQNTAETFFSKINEFPPGHFMIISQDGNKICSYWKLSTKPLPDTNCEIDDEVFLKFQELFFDAIKIRMPPELSIGSYLSG